MSVLAALDAVSVWSGKAVSWLIVPMVLSLVYEVIARYAFNSPTEWAYDITYMLYSTMFMLGAAYTLKIGAHIRTDMFYSAWSVRRRAIVDTICYAVLFFPGMVAFLVVGWDYFVSSFILNERIAVSPWMPLIYPLKFVIPLSTALLILQGTSEFLKNLWIAITDEKP